MQNSIVPYSDSDDSSKEFSNEIEEETCVGKRGYKKKKDLPNRRQQFKSVLPNSCKNQKCGCNKFTESDRVEINEHFWGIGNKIRQKDWLASCIKREIVQRKRGEGNKRKYSYNYVLNFNNTRDKVCQQFLLKTLNISQMMLRYTRKNTQLNTFNGKTKKSVPHNKSNEANISLIKSFIEQLPAVPSHYCRNKSNKLYLPQEFRNIKVVYKIYTEHLKTINKQSSQLSLRVFRSIFKNNFHIGFHLPKKDKCAICENYNNLDSKSKTELESTEEYQMHIRDKDKSKEVFLEDQRKSKANSSFLCASFDLQKVLNTPQSKSVTLFYSRKYAYYNESVYESGTRNGYCFLWGESDGKRGCNEISTIVFQYLKLVDERQTHSSISLYCDSCAGQNRNRAMLATLSYFLENSIYINTIKITYLLPGHTMMPVDSIHSTIESFIRGKTIWAPSEWYTTISNARTNPTGYNCIEMNHLDFYDWKTFSQAKLSNPKKISFKNLRSALFKKNSTIITLKYGYFDNSEIREYDLKSIARSTRHSKTVVNEPIKLYNNILNISAAKYKDLTALCGKNTIPERFHKEFLNMKYDESVRDSLPETDREDNNE